jgi:hypothetical protein
MQLRSELSDRFDGQFPNQFKGRPRGCCGRPEERILAHRPHPARALEVGLRNGSFSISYFQPPIEMHFKQAILCNAKETTIQGSDWVECRFGWHGPPKLE